MSELIVIVYKDEYRAPEILNELLRRDWDWVVDLHHAVVVSHSEKDKYRVHLRVDPINKEEAWVRLWGALISLVLADSISERMVEAVRDVSVGSSAKSGSRKESLDATWWAETICISQVFIRDVQAMIQPGDSALFMLLQTQNPSGALIKLRNYGGTLLRTTLSAEQDARLSDALK